MLISPSASFGKSSGYFKNENNQLRYQFRRSSKPSARPDGTSLMAGDIWVEVDPTGSLFDWQWSPGVNGGRWIGDRQNLSIVETSLPTFQLGSANTVNMPCRNDLLVESIKIDAKFSLNDSNSYFRYYIAAFNVDSNIAIIDLYLTGAEGLAIKKVVDLNLFVPMINASWYFVQRLAVGSPAPVGMIYADIVTREVRR